MPKNALWICYELTTILGIGSSWPQFWRSKLLPRIPDRSRIERTDYEYNTNHLITSRTDYDSTTNPKMYQFVAIWPSPSVSSRTKNYHLRYDFDKQYHEEQILF